MVHRRAGEPRPGASLAICHEWLSARDGSVKTFEAMARSFPDADLYALTWNRSAVPSFDRRPLTTTFLDRMAPLRERRMVQLPLMPLAWRYACRRRYDVVVTSSHACAKGFWPAREALHLSYCHTPMRYLWLPSVDKRRQANRASAPAERWLKSWDVASTRWVDEFAANSTVVQQRIQAVYGRPSRLIPPPVDTAFFTPDEAAGRAGFALAVSRMVPYKRLDLAIRACHRVGHPLVVAGTGPEEPALRALADELGADVWFVVNPDDEELRDLYREADVLIFPAEEDFGIVLVEAQACGVPVVAYGRGGSVDTVLPGVTGVLVPAQDEEALATGITTVLNGPFDPLACRRNAERFSVDRFQRSFVTWVLDAAAARGLDIADPRTPQTV